MGKDLESLNQSRDIRQMLIERWGKIPTSIMAADWSEKAIDLTTSYQDQKQQGQYTGTPFALSSIGARHGGLSRMPQNIIRWATIFYTPDKLANPGYFPNYLPTVLDPFAGHNSRMQAVFQTNRNYVGWDCSKQFMKMNHEVKMKLENSNSLLPLEAKIELFEADSRDMAYNEEFDFCITSPPFYNLEDYGNEAEQLGKAGLYGDFLNALQTVVHNCARALKPECFIAWEVNHFRKDGKFYPFFADVMDLFTRAGLELWDIVIIDYGSGFLQAFITDIEHLHVVSKQHSYLIVGHKRGVNHKNRQETRQQLLEVVAAQESDKPNQARLLWL